MSKNQEKVTDIENSQIDLTARQMKVLDRTLNTPKAKRVLRIAQELGVHRQTIWRDLVKIKQSKWLERQIEKLEAVEGLVFAGFVANLLSGNYEPVRDYYKGLGVFKEKFELTGKVEPSEQQKRLVENMEKLLKLKGELKPQKTMTMELEAEDSEVIVEPMESEEEKQKRQELEADADKVKCYGDYGRIRKDSEVATGKPTESKDKEMGGTPTAPGSDQEK